MPTPNAVPERRLKTYMSQVFFKAPGESEPQPMLAAAEQRKKEVYLLDELLGGGIVIPNDILLARLGDANNKPEYTTPGLVVLLTGAPGSGKSTFALELCSRLASEFSDNGQLHPRFTKGISSVYLSAEASSESLIQNAGSFGWKPAVFTRMPKTVTDLREKTNRVFIYGRELIGKEATDPKAFIEHLLRSMEQYFPFNIKVPMPKAFRSPRTPGYNRPAILVIDSLNTLGKGASPVFRDLLHQCSSRYLITIAVMDTGPGISPEHHWDPREYLADVEIDFSYDRPENYMIRRMWVVKARFQDHADGFHRMKINPKPTPTAVPNPLNPLIKEGGVFVFPSVHRHLSVARIDVGARTQPGLTGGGERQSIATPFGALDRAI